MWLLWAAVAAGFRTAATDRDALERITKGEHDALAELYDRHGRLIYSLALRILRDQSEAEDIAQEVFSQVWRQATQYTPDRGTVVAWLVALTRSRSIDRLRGRRSRPDFVGDPIPEMELPDSAPLVDEQLAWTRQVADIRAAIETLPSLQKIAIELAFFEGLTHAEIAEKLEVPLGTVKTRIRQGLLKLRDRLTQAS